MTSPPVTPELAATQRAARGAPLGWLDLLFALLLCAGYLTLLLGTSSGLGYARDEGFYFDAASKYAKWFALLSEDAATATSRAGVDAFWKSNHEHPGLIKGLFALSHLHLSERLFPDEPGLAFRFPAMLLGSLGLSVTYAWVREALAAAGGARARLAALIAAALLGCMPRVFHHAHLACFDAPVMTMWLLASWVYWRSLSRGTGWAIAAGVMYGLLLNTKHNSWLLPFALVAHLALWRGRELFRERRAGRYRLPRGLICMAFLGPLVFYALWPWIWFDTTERLVDYVKFHLHHDYYNMEFLGRTYWEPPFPRSYSWVMTLATVPAVTLVLAALGLLGATADAALDWFPRQARAAGLSLATSMRSARGRMSRLRSKPPRATLAAAGSPAGPPAVAQRLDCAAANAAEQPTLDGQGAAAAGDAAGQPTFAEPRSGALKNAHGNQFTLQTQRTLPAAGQTELLWVLSILLCYAPWVSSDTPIFGGTKHWLTAYPFLCMFAARGLLEGLERLERLQPLGAWAARPFARLGLGVALACCVLAAPVCETAMSFPWGLSAYTPLVGGAPGGATLGLNRTFWGYTTASAAPWLNQNAPARGSVYLHDTVRSAWRMHQADGLIRPDLRAARLPHASQVALYQHEPHMSRIEYQIWVSHGTTRPDWVGTHHGVPVIWIYSRKEKN